jgi:hypothetical protein
MDPHWFGWIRIRLRIEVKTGSGSALKPLRIHNTKYGMRISMADLCREGISPASAIRRKDYKSRLPKKLGTWILYQATQKSKALKFSKKFKIKIATRDYPGDRIQLHRFLFFISGQILPFINSCLLKLGRPQISLVLRRDLTKVISIRSRIRT